MDREGRAPGYRSEHLLGSRARWGRLGYEGEAFAPAHRTYPFLAAGHVRYTTVRDSGRAPSRGRDLANLHPLIAAALYEVGFAREAGPLSTWSN